MKKVLKSLSILAMIVLISFAGFGGGQNVSAAEVNKEDLILSDAELQEMNEGLEKLRQEANEKLANGDDNFTVTREVNGEDLSFTFNSNQNRLLRNLSSRNLVQPFVVRSKSYSAYIENTKAFDFRHDVYGEFTYENGDVEGYTKHSKTSGFWYAQTSKVWADRLDPSVVEISSKATHTALKYGWDYKTYISVKLFGSGDYRVTRLEATN